MPLIKQKDSAEIRECMRGGTGKARAFCSDLIEGKAITSADRMELEPGTTIGLHVHPDDEEVYAIMSGEGVYSYGDGECPARPGDIFTTHSGMSHALRNTSNTEPLVFFAVMAKK